jgi:hypothetical protein
MTDLSFEPQRLPSRTFRKRMTPQEARQRTLRVKSLRLLFIGGASLAVFGLVGSVIVSWALSAGQTREAVVQGDNLVIDKPRFVGATKSGDKVIVTAQRATRPMNSEAGSVALEKPVLETSDGSKATADTGTWSQDVQNLTLNGNVILTRKGGDQATSANAVWTSNTSQLAMTGGVKLTRADGDTATAESAFWSTEPSQLSLAGNVALNRKSGARATAGSATWRTDLDALDLATSANIILPSGESASADRVRLDDRLGNVQLDGAALVRFADGQASSARATFQSLSGQLRGEGGIQISTSLGSGRADRYVYETRSKRLTMSGNAVATLR